MHGAYNYVGGPNYANLPGVAKASSFTASAPTRRASYTTTTVYAPDGSATRSRSVSPHITRSRSVSPHAMRSQTSSKRSFKTTIPPPNTVYPGNQKLLPGIRRAPVVMASCPSCQSQSRTQTRTHPTLFTWIAVVLLVIVFWPLCWIPLVWDVFKQTDHYCSNCGSKVADVKPFDGFCEKRRGW